MFKLKRQIGHTTELDSKVVIDRFARALTEKKYDINTITENSISFYGNRGIRFRGSPLQIDEGLVNLTLCNNKTKVILSYEISFWPQIIFLAFATFIGFAIDIAGFYFFTAFVVITTPIDVYRHMSEGKEIMSSIVT